jgi:hypothetical protein
MWGTSGQIGSTIGSIAGLLGGQSKYKNPAESAQPYLDQVPQTVSPYYEPYSQAGQQSLGTLQGQYSGLVNDPAAKLSSIGSNFKQSHGYEWQVGQATNAANSAAAAGGMLGSPQEQQQLASTVSGLANQDYYNYLNQALGLYNTGLTGESNIMQTGYGAGNTLAQTLSGNLQNQAGLAYSGQANENENQGGLRGGLGGMVSGFFS